MLHTCRVFIFYLFLTNFLFAGVSTRDVQIKTYGNVNLRNEHEELLLLDLGHFLKGQSFEGKVATVSVKIKNRKEDYDTDLCMLEDVGEFEVNIKNLATRTFDFGGASGDNYLAGGAPILDNDLRIMPQRVRVLKVDHFPGALEHPQSQFLADPGCVDPYYAPIYELWFEFDVVVKFKAISSEALGVNAISTGNGSVSISKMIDDLFRSSYLGARRRK